MTRNEDVIVELVSADEALADEALEEIVGGRSWGWEKGGWSTLTTTKPLASELILAK